VPLLLTHPGMVGADTKTYLYLDPGKLLASAPYIWDAQIGLGTVTHQNIGYLFPMGPFYLLLSGLGFIPDWVAQRLWLGTVLFAAGMGVRYLLGTLGETRVRLGDADASDPTGGGSGRGLRFGPAAVVVASLSYMLSPYLLNYSARISVILLPWSALPWLIALCARSVRDGGWRHPAWFAFVVLAVGGINATALILVGLGPALWLVHAVWVDREASPRQAAAAVGRIGILTLATALWWIAGLWAQGSYGLPVLRYTETYRTVATVSSAPEALRGLGYWFFYGMDKLGPWIEPSVMYTQWVWLLALSYLLPTLALAAAAVVRWRYRAYFISLIVVGTLVAVAGHPWESPTLLGGLFQSFTRTDAGLSLRSTPRAVPLVILGTAVFLGAGIEALGRRRPRFEHPAALALALLVVANIPPMWTNDMVAANLERPEQIPAYWHEAAAHLDARGHDTRVLEIPGADFASYRWGNTVDPVLPGLMDRGYVARELFQWGSPPSANLVNALDRRLHEDSFDPQALAPIARLMGVGDVNVRSDIQYERYRVARPRQLWDLIRRAPGLGEPVSFGPTTPPNRAGPEYTLTDEVELGTPPGLPEPPRVATFPVTDPRPMLRVQPSGRPLLMAGDGDGLVDAASIGLIGADQPVFYSGHLTDASQWERVYGNGADLLVTDTNRRRSRRWGALRENTGYTERIGETFDIYDPSDQRLDLFPGAGDDAYTVSDQRAVDEGAVGGVVTATAYGNPITYTPDDRPANAFDGDPDTAWRVGTLSRVRDQRLHLRLDEPVTTDRLVLLQPVTLDRNRWLTAVRLTFTASDGTTTSLDVPLDDRSRDAAARTGQTDGQTVTFSEVTFEALSIEVLDTNLGMVDGRGGLSGVGLAEVHIPGVEVIETVRPPTDLLTRAGASSAEHRLALLLTRLRSNPAEPVRGDEERTLRRLLSLPTARSFAVSGQARISGLVDVDPAPGDQPNNAVDRLVGQPDHTEGGVTASADARLPGNLRARASAAIDGDPTTAWTAPYQEQLGRHLTFQVAEPLTFGHLDLVLVNDGRHSVPTHLRLHVDGTDRGVLEIPPTRQQDRPGATVSVRVPLPDVVTGSTLQFTIEDYERRHTDDWFADGHPIILPVAIAEIGVPGLRASVPDPVFDSGCRSDLLEIEGRPVPLRVRGPLDDALDRRALSVVACDPVDEDTVPTIELDAGDHVLRTGVGADPDIGIDIDRLVLSSDAGGGPLDLDDLPSTVDPAPATTDASFERVDASIQVGGSDVPYWLTLGQSWSEGWQAVAIASDGTRHELGPSIPVNGYANGWYVDPAVVGTGPLRLEMTWSPQRVVWVAVVLSAIGGVVCLVLMLRRPRRHVETPVVMADGRPLTPTFAPPWPWLRPTGALVPRSRTVLMASLALVVAAALNIPMTHGLPLLAIPLGLAFYRAARSTRGAGLLGLCGAAALGLAGAFTVMQQIRNGYPPEFGWPTHFARVHVLGLAAIALGGAEAVRDLLTRDDPTGTIPAGSHGTEAVVVDRDDQRPATRP
jgi:arabinofuranan 3-O-arabinosyltransferase